ncbi:MAG TPA: FAD-binding oxidoreductase [Steroidobacteraceae bacterium]|jgi:gamma-glutamylputrescine oxidase|nr:FAD-binding oxidoreductase [Steroidobacteraceae bacterium]
MPQVSIDIRPWYWAALPEPPSRPALAGAAQADVCVVGAGIAGCSAALHLAERGYRVIVLEDHQVGWGASGRSGAQAIFGVAAPQDKLETLLGAVDARRIWDMSVEALDLLRELMQRHAIDCDYVHGQMHVAIKPRQARELASWQQELGVRYGYGSTKLLDRSATREFVASDRYIAGLHDSNSGHLQPLKYVRGLATAAEALGCVIHEGSRALRYRRGAAIEVQTAQGSVSCRHLLLAGNAWLGQTAPPLARRIMGVGTYIVATEVLGHERAQALLPQNTAVTDINWVLDYFRRSTDHRLLFGGRVSYSGLDPFNTAEATRRRMVAVFPQLQEVAIEHAWGGYVDITLNRAPDFGRLEQEVYYLQGFSGHGIALTGLAGKLVAEAIAGSAERFDVFARIPHREFPGGQALRRPALVLAMLYYRLKDLL